ncbi:MAG: indole-3-glycerol phosphate synthase TrpC [Brevinematales bacterium]|nr:indole-3-glycerol phosphate synthase TrpC [Brevinematales bacterium]
MLQRIIELKRIEIEELKSKLPLEEIKLLLKDRELPKKSFLETLKRKISNNKPGLIAEIKFSSPSKGIIRSGISPDEMARIYENSEYVDCISVLTEKNFFSGDISYLMMSKSVATKPILRKDFILDEYQIYESAYHGADCILLISSSLSREQIVDYIKVADSLGMDVLVEVFEYEDFKKIEGLYIPLLGINSRNLKTLEVSLENHVKLIGYIKSFGIKTDVIVAESGIKSRNDILNSLKYGFNAFLIGETFMSSQDVLGKISDLFDGIKII